MWVGVQPSLPLLPVILGAPVLHQWVYGGGVEPVGEVGAFEGRCEAQGQVQTSLQVVEVLQNTDTQTGCIWWSSGGMNFFKRYYMGLMGYMEGYMTASVDECITVYLRIYFP